MLTDAEFEAILEDKTKRILEDVTWKEDEDRSPAVEFRVGIESESGWPLFVHGSYNYGSYNMEPRKLFYALILRRPGAGRIYALDLGRDHHNPQCNQVGEKHMHRWSEQYGDKEAYVPNDLNAPVTDPATVWTEFCASARIRHDGLMQELPPPAWRE
ncbi:MAG: hypothetical protein M2R45_00403 [Verrucomicrobia subdivision 3 bacterium]|nr:hypothetical protein [Limisphaerales bacterium]MCS1412838.1 hypothetical protein [Limisphaerales bacterium]